MDWTDFTGTEWASFTADDWSGFVVIESMPLAAWTDARHCYAPFNPQLVYSMSAKGHVI